MATASAAGSCELDIVDSHGPRATGNFFYDVRKGALAQVRHSILAGQDVNTTDDHGYTALHFAAKRARNDVCDALLTAGANVNALTGAGYSPLHLAVAGKCRYLCEALLAAGANVNALTAAGETTLHIAVLWGRHEVCDALLSAGANVNATCGASVTPLHLAVAWCRDDVTEALLDGGANVHVVNGEGSTPLQSVSEHDDTYCRVRGMLVAYGAPVAHLPTAALDSKLPKYFTAVRSVFWSRRVAALTAWVHWQDLSHDLPSLTARMDAARHLHA